MLRKNINSYCWLSFFIFLISEGNSGSGPAQNQAQRNKQGLLRERLAQRVHKPPIGSDVHGDAFYPNLLAETSSGWSNIRYLLMSIWKIAFALPFSIDH